MNETFPGKIPVSLLAVDDETRHHALIAEIFSGDEYQVTFASNGQEALEWLTKRSFDVLLLDNNMPGMSGLELCRTLRSTPHHAMLPVILVTGMNSHYDLSRAFAAGVDDFIGKPFSPMELLARVRSAARRKFATDQLDNAESILFTLAHMVEARDPTTGIHCARLSHLGQQFGLRLGLSQDELTALRRGAILHDLGKVAIPDAILNKRGPLTPEERQVMSQHPVIGAKLCQGLATMKDTWPIIRHHHEQYNGGGYPDGLQGEAIPLLARIFQILDIYDALKHKRPYKEALPLERVLAILTHEAGLGQSDPNLVAEFVDFSRNTSLFTAPTESLEESGGAIFRELLLSRVLVGTRFDPYAD